MRITEYFCKLCHEINVFYSLDTCNCITAADINNEDLLSAEEIDLFQIEPLIFTSSGPYQYAYFSSYRFKVNIFAKIPDKTTESMAKSAAKVAADRLCKQSPVKNHGVCILGDYEGCKLRDSKRGIYECWAYYDRFENCVDGSASHTPCSENRKKIKKQIEDARNRLWK